MNGIIWMIFSANWNGYWSLDKAGEWQNGQELFGSFLTHSMEMSWLQHDVQINFLIDSKDIGHENNVINREFDFLMF
jgi:hypothetical protein